MPDEVALPLEPPPQPIKDKMPNADKTIKREFIRDFFGMGWPGCDQMTGDAGTKLWLNTVAKALMSSVITVLVSSMMASCVVLL